MRTQVAPLTEFISRPSTRLTPKPCQSAKCQLISTIVLIIILIIVIFIALFLNKQNKESTSATLSINSSSITIIIDTTMEITTAAATTVKLETKQNILIETRKWRQNAITVAGGNERGDELNQLSTPTSICINDDDDNNQTLYIADQSNDRIMAWNSNARAGRIVLGGNEFNWKIKSSVNLEDILFDKQSNSLIICDIANKRILRWSLENTTDLEILLSNISCRDLALDKHGYLYIVGNRDNQIKRWKNGISIETVISHGYFELNQTRVNSTPNYITLGNDGSVYTSDYVNHVVLKWTQNSSQGTIVAGGHGRGNQLIQLHEPMGIIVDEFDNIYIADFRNHRIVCWMKEAKEGRVIAGGNGDGMEVNQFTYPTDLLFDKYDNLYVLDTSNDRVQKFLLDLSQN